jgi:TP901 family phage tail tape measure protein
MSDTSLLFNLLAVDHVSGPLGIIKSAFGGLGIAIGAGAVVAGDKLIKMAGDFQFGITRLETGAGELHSNLAEVSAGILDMAGKVGESTKELNAGMYLVESAGFHGAEGLKVLQYAAEGAKVGNADMATVADAVTTALNAYRLGADHAAEATNALIAAEGQGKTNLEALSGSLATVAPIAAVAHVSLNEVLAAMATMTGEGTDAASAATYLKQTIGQLSNPTGKAAQEMKSLGLNATQVSMNLGKNGLASTLTMLTDAIQAKMGPAGTVLIEHLQKAAKNTTEFQKVLANLPPAQQTYVGALANMVGGTKSMQAALELTGDNMKVFQHNTDVINEKVKAGGQSIEGWAQVQQTFNQHLAEFKGQVEAVSIKIGTALLPYAMRLLSGLQSLGGVVKDVVGWMGRHKDVVAALAITMGVLVAITKAHAIAMELEAAGSFVNWILKVTNLTKVWAAVQWLLNVAMDANPIGLIIIAVAALAVGFVYLWTHSSGFRNFFIGMWHDIWGFLKAVGAWFAGPFAHFFVQVWHVISEGALWLWHNVLEPVWNGISATVSMSVRIITSLANLLAYIFKVEIGEPVMWLWHNAVEPAMHGIAAAAKWLWQNELVPFGKGVADVAKGVASVAMWLWHNALEPAIHGIANVATWLYSNVIHPVFGFVMDRIRETGHVFGQVFGAIGGFISSAFHGAVNSVRDNINALISLVNSAVGFINSNVIDSANRVPGVNFPHIPTIPHLAVGGDVLATGLAVIHTGERVVPAAQVRQLPAGGAAPQPQQRTVRFAGNLDSAFATAFQKMVRAGLITIE